MKWYLKLMIVSYSGYICFCMFSVFAAGEIVSGYTEMVQNYIGDVTYDGDTLVDLLYNAQETKKIKRNLISHYCDTLLHKEHAKKMKLFGFSNEGYLYDPRQSWFVYTLCTNVDEVAKGRKLGDDQYIYRNYKKVFDDTSYDNGVKHEMTKYVKEDADMNLIRGIPSQQYLDAKKAYTACNPGESMQGCDFSSFLPTIFSTVINDYTNMKLASLYGYQEIKGLEANDPNTWEKAVKAFSLAYFGDDGKDANGNKISEKVTICNTDNTRYLYPRDQEINKKHCSHPETYKFVEETIKSSVNLLKKTKLINAELYLENACGAKQNETMICSFAVHGNSSFQDDTKRFKNLLLNELLRYNLFITYYTQAVISDPSYHPLTMGSVTFAYQRGLREATTLAQEQQLARQAIFQSTRMLYQILIYFPIHVGLSAYYEDLINYRKTLTSAYTPLHQLSYKLRNVQACMQ